MVKLSNKFYYCPIATHSVLKGLGVGDDESTALSATITWILKDGAGHLGRIFFAYWKG